MEETKSVKCPHCGAVMNVRKTELDNVKDPTKSRIRCNVCKRISPVSSYIFVESADAEATQYSKNSEETEYADDARKYDNGGEKTETGSAAISGGIGQFRIASTGRTILLREGRQTVGRKVVTMPDHADIEIANQSKRMSHKHIVIEVKKIGPADYVHYVSLFKERVNDTYVAGSRLMWGDKVILRHGMRIALPDEELTFEINNEEQTRYDE